MSEYSIGIVSAPYHAAVRRMQAVAEERIRQSAIARLSCLIEVRGSFEIPLQAKHLLARGDIDAVVSLGAIEKGETGHGIALARAVFPTLLALSLEFGKPLGLGIIGPDATPEQIEARAEKIAIEATAAVLDSLKLNDAAPWQEPG